MPEEEKMNLVGAFNKLQSFLMFIKEDNKITGNHIAVYLALYEKWILHDCTDPFPIERSTIMNGAKISGVATYYKCMNDLHAYGYIIYQPSFNASAKSKVCLDKLLML